MSQGLFPRVPTTLDLNGPILSFTTNPVGVATTSGESVTLTGIATVSFGSTADNTGSIAYRWYEVGTGALSDGTKFTGTGTTTLTISNATTPDDNNRKFYLQADYTPSIETGNASNEPLASGIATVTVSPLIEIVAQPTDSQALVNTNTTFTINAGLTDSTYGNVTYQWYLDGDAVNDGTITQYEDVGVKTTVTTYQTIDQTLYRTINVSEQKTENRTFTSDGSVTLHPSSYDVVVRVAGASGGKGGDDADGGTGGAGGPGRFGRFFYNGGGRTLTFRIGRRGNDGGSGSGSGGGSGGSGGANGGRGGDAGTDGWSGGGGGGGGATTVEDSRVGRTTIIAAGGSGGGGGSWRVAGGNGAIGQGFGGGPVSLLSSGADGQSKGGGDGGGGGGSGGGCNRGAGGRSGTDNSSASTGGESTRGAYDSGQMTFPFDGSEHNGNGYAQIEWKWTDSYTEQEPYTQPVTVPVEVEVDITQSLPRNIVLSGTKTPTLTIRADREGANEIKCRVSSTVATNSPLFTNTVQYSTLSTAEQYNVYVEAVGATDNAFLTSINLFNGDYEFLTSVGDPTNNAFTSIYSFYSLDKDIDVEMDLYGAKGDNVGSYVGGEGGFSRIRFTMTQNTEYVIAGLTTSINSPFVYRKGTLIACVGKGGSAGLSGNGGFGGGIGIGGQSGFGRNAGVGGVIITAGNLPANGIFGSYTGLTATAPDTKAVIPNGGRVLPCTKGVYWRQQGFSACSDVGSSKYRLSDGTIVTNTATITRGYKSGYNIIQNSGAGIGNGGRGGNGATGGQGGDGGGGGGGSGYTDGSVTVVDTQLGGSTFANAKVILRVVTS